MMSRKKIACIKYIQKHCSKVTPKDLPKPIIIKHEPDDDDKKYYYSWNCPCGITVISTRYYMATQLDIGREIYSHIVWRHDIEIWQKQLSLSTKINELNDLLSPANLDELEPRIHKLIAEYHLVSKWRRICSEYPNINE